MNVKVDRQGRQVEADFFLPRQAFISVCNGRVQFFDFFPALERMGTDIERKDRVKRVIPFVCTKSTRPQNNMHQSLLRSRFT